MLKKRLALTALLFTVLPIAASAQTSSASRCDQLATFYDRSAEPVPFDQGWTPPGRAERTLGYEECRKGKTDAGIRLLEEAILKAGYKVPAA